MTDTTAVSGRTASSTCSAVMSPFLSGARYVTSQPCCSSQRQHSSTALCSTAVVTMCRPMWRFCHTAAVMAQLSPSVPQEVKYSCFASQPMAAATVCRQLSTRFFMSSPRPYWALGLPNCSVST